MKPSASSWAYKDSNCFHCNLLANTVTSPAKELKARSIQGWLTTSVIFSSIRCHRCYNFASCRRRQRQCKVLQCPWCHVKGQAESSHKTAPCSFQSFKGFIGGSSTCSFVADHSHNSCLTEGTVRQHLEYILGTLAWALYHKARQGLQDGTTQQSAVHEPKLAQSLRYQKRHPCMTSGCAAQPQS
jgi:hypothetical protein